MCGSSAGGPVLGARKYLRPYAAMNPNFGHLPYLAYGLGFDGVGVQVQKDKPALEGQNIGCRLKIKATYVYTFFLSDGQQS